MAFVGRDLAYEPAALAILSFLLTWGLIGLLQLASRGIGSQGASVGGGAH
jgi:putative spermidine/putrescine transport system permease protein